MARLPVDRTVMAPRIVRAVGMHTSPSRPVDDDQPGAWLELVLDLSDLVRETPATFLRLAIQRSTDGSAFVDDAVITYRGHLPGITPHGMPEDLPGVQVALSRYRNRHIRATLTVANQPTEVGIFLRVVN